MSEDIVPDVGTKAPTGSDQTTKLRVHFILYGIPTDIAADYGAKELTAGDGPIAIEVAVNIPAEEAPRVRELLRYVGAIVVETEESDGQTHRHPITVHTKQRAE